MREYIDAFTISNEVAMLRTAISGAILLIDHEDEGRFYKSIIHDKATIVPSPKIASELLFKLKIKGISGIVAIVRKPKTAQTADDIFYPDAGDVASTLLNSSQLGNVMANISGGRWIDAANKQVEGLITRCRYLGKRINNFCESRQITLTSSEVGQLVNWNSVELNEQALDQLHSSNIQHSKKIQLKSNTYNTLSSGEIALEILALCTSLFKPHDISCEYPVSRTELSRLLEVSFKPEDLEGDSIFWLIRAWERKNQKHPLLKRWRTLDAFGLVWDQRYWENDIQLIVKHTSGNLSLCLMKLDLDNFKNVNDTLGHAKGDDAIKLASSVIKIVLGSVGEVYRRGGDEFIIISPQTDESCADILAETLRKELELSFAKWSASNELSKAPTASIGVVNMVAGMQIHNLIDLVDTAQKNAKALGKNRVHRERIL